MKKGQEKRTDNENLRRRAEARLIERQKDGGKVAGDRLTAAEIQRRAQEQEIYQIELELQNEELKKAWDEAEAQRENAEAERERYLNLYDFAPVGYLTLDKKNIIRRVNFAGAGLLGAVRSQLLNRCFCEFVSRADIPKCKVFLKKVFENKIKQCCDITLGEGGSQCFYVQMTATVSEDGEECFVVLVDETESKQAEDELRKLHEELEQRVLERTVQLEAANKELESFSYSVSHDLQTPLRAIDGYSRMILKKYGEQFNDDARQLFDVIRSSTQRMGELISRLLDFSRLGRKHLSSTTLDISAIIREAWNELKIINPDRSMALEMDGLPQAMGDPGLISQVVGNILSNAVKFAKGRDRVIVEVGGYQRGNESVYSIKDNGVGFDMAYYNMMFGMFQRLHNPDEYEGTGVGLAIAQRIINRHGGRIWAESEPNKGATFYFSLPTCIGSGI